MSADTYQVGAHFKALNEAVLMALYKILEICNPFKVSQPPCALTMSRLHTHLHKILVTIGRKTNLYTTVLIF